MSQLAIFRPAGNDAEPRILSFAQFAAKMKSDRVMGITTRARLEHEHRTCPHCGCGNIAPVESGLPSLNRNGAVIPRTRELAGFSCNGCGNVWLV